MDPKRTSTPRDERRLTPVAEHDGELLDEEEPALDLFGESGEEGVSRESEGVREAGKQKEEKGGVLEKLKKTAVTSATSVFGLFR